jgi:hypothetical protein
LTPFIAINESASGRARQHGGVVMMLEIGEFVEQRPRVVAVNKSDRTANLGFRGSRNVLDQFVPDQIAKCLRTICVAAFGEQLVELFQQVAADGDADPRELRRSFFVAQFFPSCDDESFVSRVFLS